MKAIFSIVGLLLVVAIVGLITKKQLSSGVAPPVAGAPAGANGQPMTPKQQVDQFKAAAEAAVQSAPRAMPEDTQK